MIKPRTKKSNARKRPVKGFLVSTTAKKTAILLMAGVALVALVVVINGFPVRPGSQYGVGADGFSAFQVQGANLGTATIVKRSVVQDEFGSLLKSVSDIDLSGVVSINGNKGQTATYYVVTKNGAQGSFYVDAWLYKSDAAHKAADITIGTGDAGKVGDLSARFLPAVTIANTREYAILISKGLYSYKFAFTQPYDNVKLDETTVQSALKKVAEKANLL